MIRSLIVLSLVFVAGVAQAASAPVKKAGNVAYSKADRLTVTWTDAAGKTQRVEAGLGQMAVMEVTTRSGNVTLRALVEAVPSAPHLIIRAETAQGERMLHQGNVTSGSTLDLSNSPALPPSLVGGKLSVRYGSVAGAATR